MPNIIQNRLCGRKLLWGKNTRHWLTEIGLFCNKTTHISRTIQRKLLALEENELMPRPCSTYCPDLALSYHYLFRFMAYCDGYYSTMKWTWKLQGKSFLTRRTKNYQHAIKELTKTAGFYLEWLTYFVVTWRIKQKKKKEKRKEKKNSKIL